MNRSACVCVCVAHEAGLVGLHVWMDSRVVSSSVLFEYRARNASSLPSSQLDWLSLDGKHTHTLSPRCTCCQIECQTSLMPQ